jgi:hypothetical protein
MKLTKKQIQNAEQAWHDEAMAMTPGVFTLSPEQIIKAIAPHIQYAALPAAQPFSVTLEEARNVWRAVLRGLGGIAAQVNPSDLQAAINTELARRPAVQEAPTVAPEASEWPERVCPKCGKTVSYDNGCVTFSCSCSNRRWKFKYDAAPQEPTLEERLSRIVSAEGVNVGNKVAEILHEITPAQETKERVTIHYSVGDYGNFCRCTLDCVLKGPYFDSNIEAAIYAAGLRAEIGEKK